jgi:hypothetical protein
VETEKIKRKGWDAFIQIIAVTTFSRGALKTSLSFKRLTELGGDLPFPTRPQPAQFLLRFSTKLLCNAAFMQGSSINRSENRWPHSFVSGNFKSHIDPCFEKCNHCRCFLATQHVINELMLFGFLLHKSH